MKSGCSVFGYQKTLISIVVCTFIVPTVPASQAVGVDPFMGDWEGHGQAADGEPFRFVAQVIAWGDGQYQINVLEAFAQRAEPLHVMDGLLQGDTYTYTADGGRYRGQCVLDGETCRGAYQGDVDGRFEMHRVVRRSPTLSAEPPAGAIVLFDGSDFHEWLSLGGRKGAMNIAEAVGSVPNAVAYLKATLWSPREQSATLELGSDDGVKVWLNDKRVHANNALRGVSPGDDKVPVTLRRGANELVLKVTNGGGDWGAIARFVRENGKPIRTIREVSPSFGSDSGSNEYVKKNNGYLTQWQVAGPYQQGGKGPEVLFDVAFAPETTSAEEIAWKWVNANEPQDKAVKWRLVAGAMETRPGTGSIVTKRQFKDFKLHIEFRTPFMPKARGQGRGNSGVYLQGRYEVQVLDSYGLEGQDNECGGIYKVGAPLVHMCLPPAQWQTYDITFRAPRFDNAGGKVDDAVVTVVHNGVAIHDQRKIPGPTGGALDTNVAEPGGLYLQDHGNPVRFRNIWLVELDP